ncbi:MAG: MBL fold metallo-hydrolase RNA specificity domain-containing protein, partial [Candidatus Woesearchaeota archaeon]
ELLKAIEETVQKKGKILIPTFAIERTQELLYDLDVLYEKNLVPHIPVYLDSPMAVKATEIYKKFPEFYEEPLRELIRNGENPFHFPNLKYSIRVEESMAINAMKGPIIIMAGSGMCTAGRIKHHIKHEIGHENNAIIFVGYQSPGSLGFHIKRGEKTVRLLGKQIPVKAKVYSIDSFSGHADYNGLLTWFDRILPQPKKVFVTHGDEESAKAFVQKLQDNGVDAHDPYIGEEIEL